LGTVGPKLFVAVAAESVELAVEATELAAADSAGFREHDRQIRRTASNGAAMNLREIRALRKFIFYAAIWCGFILVA
jgi:hypothetical protein